MFVERVRSVPLRPQAVERRDAERGGEVTVGPAAGPAFPKVVPELAGGLGFPLEEVPRTGGGSDGNFTAALGIPTLDGLGVDGRGAHAVDEQLYYSSLEPRAKLFLRLLETLE